MAQKAAFIFALALVQVICSDAQLMDKEFKMPLYRPPCIPACDFGFGGPPYPEIGCYPPFIRPPISIGGQPIGSQPPLGGPTGMSPPMGVSPPFGGPIQMSPPMGVQPPLGMQPPAGNPPQMQGPPANFLQSQNLNENYNSNVNHNSNF